MTTNMIVARFRDGRTLKGTTLNVDPSKPKFHLRIDETRVDEIKLNDLKALFFVKDLTGNPAHNEAAEPTAGDLRLVGAKKIAVRFSDGETIIGMSNRFPPLGAYFFMIPIDPKSNNIRILVNRSATTSIVDASQLTIR